MKRIITGIIALAALATANAQTPISSVNAAGYIKVTVEPSKFYLIQTPFNKFDGSSITLDDVFGAALPDLSEVYVWFTNNQQFQVSTFIEGAGFSPNFTLTRGQGLFIKPSDLGSAASYDVFLAGEVPGATSAASTPLTLVNGFNAVGFPYPVSTTLNNSGLNGATEDLDEVYMWNPGNQSYSVFTRFDIPGSEWNGAENTVITPGSALFVKKQSGGTFTASVPYSWPNN